MSSEWDLTNYKIINIADENYDDLAANLFDFKVMLRPHIALDKRITRDSNYRPEYAYYSYQGEDYARLRFEFDVSLSTNLLTERTQWLAYYETDGSLGPEFMIKHRAFDHLNPVDLDAAIQEQVQLRKEIAAHIKATILTVVSINEPGKSVGEIVMQTQPFYDELTLQRAAFIDLGSPSYGLTVQAIDLNLTPHSYLAYYVAPGVTLKDYIVSMTL